MHRTRFVRDARRSTSPRRDLDSDPYLLIGNPRPRKRQTGQALAEFTLLLPLMLMLFGAGIDLSRVFFTYVNLQAATRVAAEYVATDPTGSQAAPVISTQAIAQTNAKQMICRQVTGDPSCTNVTVTVTTFSICPTTCTPTNGGTVQTPAATVTVNATIQFRTVVPWWFMTNNGVFTLSASETYQILRYKA